MTQELPERRGRTVALVGLIFQTLVFAFYAVLAVWSESESLQALAYLTVTGIPIWLALLLTYHQRVLVQEEAFETEELRREREAGLQTETVFEGDAEQLLLARRRLRWMYRWMLPGFAVVVIAGLALLGLYFWPWSLRQAPSEIDWPPIVHTDIIIWFLGGTAFLCFLLSRYVVGMTRYAEWQMLRAGASYLMGMTLGSVAVAACLGAIALSDPTGPWLLPEQILAYVLRLLLVVLSVEFALNLVLDFYRPRGADEVPRPAFESRLLGLFTEPGGIARSIAEAINYQFGFEVSSTWFYKLLERSAVPLLGFCIVCMLGASCLLFVGEHQQAVVARFGRYVGSTLGPGLHLVYPWPIDHVAKVDIDRVHTLKLGIQMDEPTRRPDPLILWTNPHEQEPHLNVLVATPRLAEFIERPEETAPEDALPAESALLDEIDEALAAEAAAPRDAVAIAGGEAVSVSKLRISVDIEYRIRDAFDWVVTYRNPEALLKAIAEREITRRFASADVDRVLGPQRGAMEDVLLKAIQAETDRAALGVDILFAGLQGVHPPVEAAEAFQEVIGAEQKKTVTIRSAVADYNKRLASVAGDVRRAEQLAEVIREVNELSADPNATDAQLEAARDRQNALLFGDQAAGIRPVGGEASRQIAQARPQRWRLENQAHADAMAFETEMALHDASPAVYKARRYLRAIAESTGKIRKYLNATRHAQGSNTFHLDIKDPMAAPLGASLDVD